MSTSRSPAGVPRCSCSSRSGRRCRHHRACSRSDLRPSAGPEFASLVNRYYDPSTAQFLSIDPLVATTGQPYQYAGDDPVNESDASGLITLPACGGNGPVGTSPQKLKQQCAAELNQAAAVSRAGCANGGGCGNSGCGTWGIGCWYPLIPIAAALCLAGGCAAVLAAGASAASAACSVAADNPELGNGGEAAASTGRADASSLIEQLAMESAQADPASGRVLPLTMSDDRWPASEGWVKMAQNINGVEIHYVYNTVTGVAADWKFK